MQLSIYHQLFANMIDGKVDFNMVCSALGLDLDYFFSDGFLVEVGPSYSDAGILRFEALLENNTLNVCLQISSLSLEIVEIRYHIDVRYARDSKQGPGNCMPTWKWL